MSAFPENLRAAREEAGLSQKIVAIRLGISPATYSQYESGKKNPSFEIFCKIGDILDVSLDQLAGRADDEVDYLKAEENDDEHRLKRYIYSLEQIGYLIQGDDDGSIDICYSLPSASMRSSKSYRVLVRFDNVSQFLHFFDALDHDFRERLDNYRSDLYEAAIHAVSRLRDEI